MSADRFPQLKIPLGQNSYGARVYASAKIIERVRLDFDTPRIQLYLVYRDTNGPRKIYLGARPYKKPEDLAAAEKARKVARRKRRRSGATAADVRRRAL